MPMEKTLCLIALHCILCIPANAAPLAHLLGDNVVNVLQNNCKSKNGGCNSQDDKAPKIRAAVKKSLTQDLGYGHFPPMSDNQAEELLDGTQQVKLAFNALNKLIGVVPYDNGLIGGDRVILSKTELDTLLGRLKGALPSLDANLSKYAPVPLVGGRRRKRTNSVSLDYYRGNRWPSNTINVFIDSNIWSSTEANIIRQALKAISSKVPCLSFVESTQDPKIEILKVPEGTDSGTCGWSSVGYQKGQRNSVNVNFDSSICRPSIQGVVVHEVLHALGCSHEHTRYDRDNYIDIMWENVDPQAASDYDKDDDNDYNPYGVQYDCLSIMHYDQGVGAKSAGKKTMVPRLHPEQASKMGTGNDMSATDVKLVKRLYCTSPNCRDAGPNCGWKALKGECDSIRSSCPKSCGTCDKTTG